jgi:hypothetical protein
VRRHLVALAWTVVWVGIIIVVGLVLVHAGSAATGTPGTP